MNLSKTELSSVPRAGLADRSRTVRGILDLKRHRQHAILYLFVLPSLLFVALFQYYPAASGIFHSFYRWNGSDVSEYIGLENYTSLLGSSAFWQSFKVALILGLANVIKMVPAIAVAVCIHRCRSARIKFLYRVMFVVPMVIPGLVVALIWRSFFFESNNGLLNQLLDSTGLLTLLSHVDRLLGWGGVFAPGKSPSWLGDPHLILVACILWGFPWVGSFAVLTHLAKLGNIGRDVYEAAEIDGISWWTKFTYIELPLLMNSIYLLLVFVIIDTIKDAGMILALAGIYGGPGGKVTVPALFMIQKAFLNQEMGAACAIGIILMAIVMLLQKISSVLLTWSDATAAQRTATRFALFVLGVGLLYQGSMPLFGAAAIAAAVPWRRLLSLIPIPSPRRQPPRPTTPTSSTYRQLPRRSNRTVRRVNDGLLRVLRHAFILCVLAVSFIPLYLMMVVSFKSNVQFYDEPAHVTRPLHPENWSAAWTQISPTIYNSIFISTSATLLTLIMGVAAAYFFARRRMPLSGFLWNAFLVLMMMPTIANLVPLFRLLGDLNLLNTVQALILVGASGGQAFAIFILRSFIADIPRELLEAAEMDGCSHFRQVTTVVLPLAAPVLGTVAVMQFIAQWNDFVLPLIVMRDRERLPVMVELLRMSGEYVKTWGPMMAGYTLASLPIIFLFIVSMRLFTANATEGAIK